MRIKKYCGHFCGWLLLWICLAAGCAGRDRALVLPVTDGTESAAGESEPASPGARESADEEGQLPEDEAPVSAGEDPERKATIYVYVCGHVAQPGVVELAEGSRAQDALRAAGGFAEDARQDAVNLAEPVCDGQMLRFPGLEEEWEEPAAADGTSDGRININTADAALLTSLNGIGSSRAQDIIAYREANGAFQSIEEIKKVSGIKDSIYEKIKDRITVR